MMKECSWEKGLGTRARLLEYYGTKHCVGGVLGFDSTVSRVLGGRTILLGFGNS